LHINHNAFWLEQDESMKSLSTGFLAAAIALLSPNLSHAADQPLSDAALPSTGMTMSSVQAKYGVPLKKLDPIGKPPISRWQYPKFTVYFEYDHVVHSIQMVDLPPKVTVAVDNPSSATVVVSAPIESE
jgi:hypothetical protein